MAKVIEELILKNSYYIENVPHNKTYWSFIEDNNKIYEKLKETLNKEELALLNKIIDNHGAIEAEVSDSSLIKGFKTGLKLLFECL